MDFVDIHIMKTYLDTKATSINVVSEKEIWVLPNITTDIKDLHKVVL